MPLQRFLSRRFAAPLLLLAGCGGSKFNVPPVALSVSLSSAPITVVRGGSPVNVPVTIMAPTETATFFINGLPPGVAASYKESESNPSGLLTLMASSTATVGTTMPVITVGSSGQTATTTFILVVSAK